MGFVNGLPLLFIECKTIYKDVRRAYDGNLSDYKDVIPHLFHHNAFIVLGNGVDAKIGSLSSKFEHFNDWKRLAESDPGVVDMETLLKGVCTKRDFLDLFENFIIFDESTGGLIKIVARNHQYIPSKQSNSPQQIRAVSEVSGEWLGDFGSKSAAARQLGIAGAGNITTAMRRGRAVKGIRFTVLD